MANRVLLVEDDDTIGRSLARALRSQGLDVEWSTAGRDALERALAEPPDLVLLDLGLPDADGVEVCRVLRQRLPGVAVVMLTARRDEIDVVVGLDAGADDYIVKPFRLAELLARVRAHLRRGELARAAKRVVVGDLEVDLGARRVFLGGEELELRAKEFDLLALLAGEAGQVVERDRIMSEVWDAHWYGSTKTLDMHISSLRRKLGRGAAPGCRITTVRGVGYRMETG